MPDRDPPERPAPPDSDSPARPGVSDHDLRHRFLQQSLEREFARFGGGSRFENLRKAGAAAGPSKASGASRDLGALGASQAVDVLGAARRAWLERLIGAGEELERCGRDGAAGILFQRAASFLRERGLRALEPGSDPGRVEGEAGLAARDWAFLPLRRQALENGLEAAAAALEKLRSFFPVAPPTPGLHPGPAAHPGAEAENWTREWEALREAWNKFREEAERTGGEAGIAEARSLPDLRPLQDRLTAFRTRLLGRALQLLRLRLSGFRLPGPLTETVPQAGPYNHRETLKGLLAGLARADLLWVEDFLGLYRDLGRLENLFKTATSRTGGD